MRLVIPNRPGGRAFVALAGVLLAAGFLAGCASTTGGSAGGSGSSGSSGGLAGFFGAKPDKNVVTVASDNTYSTELFLKQGYCPPVQIRAGTEQFRQYDRGHDGDAAFIRYQGSISETARECTALGLDSLSIRVGIAGRVVAGPTGVAGTATLPIRVVVMKQLGSAVLFSQVYKVPVALAAPDLSSAFTQVAEQVNFKLGPGDRDLIVYVGFDEGAPKPKPVS